MGRVPVKPTPHIMYRRSMSQSVCARQAQRQLQRHPDTVPVVVEADEPTLLRLSPEASAVLESRRFAPPKTWTVAQFFAALRSRMRLPSQYAMFLFVSREPEDNVLPCNSSTMEEVYAEHADPSTGILWVTLVVERTFGALCA